MSAPSGNADREPSWYLPLDRSGLAESLRSFVSAWECDENNHWSTRFYSRAFQMASENMAGALSGRSPGSGISASRHIRFRQELLSGDTMRVLSGIAGGGPLAGCLVHFMHRCSDGNLCATAFDEITVDLPWAPRLSADRTKTAQPKGLRLGVPARGEDTGVSTADGWFRTHVDIARPAEFDHTGTLLTDALVSRVSHAGPHVWNQIGINWSNLHERGLGRVQVEMKLARLCCCKPGDMIQVFSRVGAFGQKTLAFHHRIRNAHTSEAIACSENLAVFIDARERRAVPIPEDVKETYRQLMAERQAIKEMEGT